MLEKMDEFFNNRLEGYEEHQLTAINSAEEFYPFTAALLPTDEKAKILDLGCGTGLELGFYFKLNSTAKVVGIDLAEDMLNYLKGKFPDKDITPIKGSYFDIPFGENCYDGAISVESLHHFTKEEKIPLYKKIFRALTKNGCFILTDYFAASDEEEEFFRKELLRLKTEQGITDNAFYHFDTPLTLPHEIQALREAGFSSVEILKQWGATAAIRAGK